jgi:hypothetical protein
MIYYTRSDVRSEKEAEIMRRITTILVACLLAIAGAVAAGFDSLEDIGPDCTVVGSRIIDGVTVTISTHGGYGMVACTYYDSLCYAFDGADGQKNAPLNPGNVSGARFISSVGPGQRFPYAQPVIFEFDQPVTLFGLTTLDLCEDDDPTAELSLRAYDALDNVVDSHSRSGAQGPSGLDLDWCVTGHGIVKVLLTGTISEDYPGYGIDDLVLLSPCVSGVKGTPSSALVSLRHNYPNPFESQTAIAYDLESRGQVTLEIFDVSGRRVCTLANEVQAVGAHLETWYAATSSGKEVAAGVYFCRLTFADVTTGQTACSVNRMVLMK